MIKNKRTTRCITGDLDQKKDSGESVMNQAMESIQEVDLNDHLTKEITVFSSLALGVATVILGWLFFWAFSLAMDEHFSGVLGFLRY